jgi:hypothetical protein
MVHRRRLVKVVPIRLSLTIFTTDSLMMGTLDVSLAVNQFSFTFLRTFTSFQQLSRDMERYVRRKVQR